MPHMFQIIDCKRCPESYCAVCKEQCPKCGAEDDADQSTLHMRERMRQHMRASKKTFNEEK